MALDNPTVTNSGIAETVITTAIKVTRNGEEINAGTMRTTLTHDTVADTWKATFSLGVFGIASLAEAQDAAGDISAHINDATNGVLAKIAELSA